MVSGAWRNMRQSFPGGWKIVPRGVQNGLLEASRGLLGTIWPPRPPGSRIWAAFRALLGRSWRPLGSSWGLLDCSWGLLGRSWGPLGRSWGPFWPPGGSFWSFLMLFFGVPLRNHENLENRRQYGTFRCFFRSRGVQNRSKIDPSAGKLIWKP